MRVAASQLFAFRIIQGLIVLTAFSIRCKQIENSDQILIWTEIEMNVRIIDSHLHTKIKEDPNSHLI